MLGVGIILCADFQTTECWAQWHAFYKEGLQAMERGDWNRAVENFQQALKVKDQDTRKVRAYGTVFIEYFPHREMGIAFFHLGDSERAKQELSLSLSQAFSEKAKIYLDRITRGERPSKVPATPLTKPEKPTPSLSQPSPVERKTATDAATLVGERLSIAVLPFESKGIGGELGGMDLLDKLITAFVNINRFKVIERAQLEKILAEQKLGISGIVDASTAAQIGKGIGVDAVLVGSVTRAQNAVSVDARLIDTETAAIITARDAYSTGIGLQNISQMITDLATKIKTDLPLVDGYVIGIQGEKVTLDIGHKNGIRKGMKCHVYREGAPIVHPVTGEVIGKMIDELCEAQITDVFDAYAIAAITKPKSGIPQIRDKVVTK
jgi:TolB-like protein